MPKLKPILVLAVVLSGAQAVSAQELRLRFWQGHWAGESLNITRTVDVTEFHEVTETYLVKIPVGEDRVVTDPQDPTKEVTRTVWVYRAEERTRTRTVPVTRKVAVEQEFTLAKTKELKLQRASGEKIDASGLAEVFSKPTTVIELPHGAVLSDAQRALLRPEVIVSFAAEKVPPPISDDVRATIDELRATIDVLSGKINLLQQQVYGAEIPMPDSPEVPPPADVREPPPPAAPKPVFDPPVRSRRVQVNFAGWNYRSPMPSLAFSIAPSAPVAPALRRASATMAAVPLLVVVIVLGSMSAASAQPLSLRYWRGLIEGDRLTKVYQVDVPVWSDKEITREVKVPRITVVPADDPDAEPARHVRYVTETRTLIVKTMSTQREERAAFATLEAMKEMKLETLGGDAIDPDEYAELFSKSTVVLELPPGKPLTMEQRALLRDNLVVSVDGSKSSPFHQSWLAERGDLWAANFAAVEPTIQALNQRIHELNHAVRQLQKSNDKGEE